MRLVGLVSLMRFMRVLRLMQVIQIYWEGIFVWDWRIVRFLRVFLVVRVINVKRVVRVVIIVRVMRVGFVVTSHYGESIISSWFSEEGESLKKKIQNYLFSKCLEITHFLKYWILIVSSTI